MSDTKPVYDADYFIAKFSAIPDENWGTQLYVNEKGQKCGLGHCGVKPGLEKPPEAVSLLNLFDSFLGQGVTGVNDYVSPWFPQETPKARILAALQAIKEKENQ